MTYHCLMIIKCAPNLSLIGHDYGDVSFIKIPLSVPEDAAVVDVQLMADLAAHAGITHLLFFC